LARERAEQGAPDGLVVRADEQTGGRGREGRVWDSPPGNLYTSFVIRSDRPLRTFPELSFVAALAVRDAATEAVGGGHDIKLKWPNDVLARGCKLSGILIETAGDPIAAIIGIGINILSAPAAARWPATHLGALIDAPPTPDRLMEMLAGALDRRLEIWERDGFTPIRSAWMAHAMGLGESMLLRTAQEETKGRFMDLDQDGALLMEVEGGAIRRVAAGDVTPLIAAG
jgi:BirA family biotin operon repressor/biotin-[acetyl-CoA-carboxylase] ligase